MYLQHPHFLAVAQFRNFGQLVGFYFAGTTKNLNDILGLKTFLHLQTL